MLAAYQKETVNAVRLLGNEANHELRVVTEQEAQTALLFVQHVLEGVYEHASLRGQLPT